MLLVNVESWWTRVAGEGKLRWFDNGARQLHRYLLVRRRPDLAPPKSALRTLYHSAAGGRILEAWVVNILALVHTAFVLAHFSVGGIYISA
jgi:hypothetical protein